MDNTNSGYNDLILLELLDRPIAFHRCFVRITGSVNAALMLSQALYWSKRTSDSDGWFFKSQKDWEDETGLSDKAQLAARKHLKSRKLIDENLKGVPAVLYYRVNIEHLKQALSSLDSSVSPKGGNWIPPKGETSIPQRGKLDSPKGGNLLPPKGETSIPQRGKHYKETETTSETTSEITSEREQSALSVEPSKSEDSINDPEPSAENSRISQLAAAFVQELLAEYEECFSVYRQRGVDIDASRIGLYHAVQENPAKYEQIKDRRLFVRKWLHNERAKFPGYNAEAMLAAYH